MLFALLQDLVEVLSAKKTWYTPRKVSQQAYERNAQGGYAGFEEEVSTHRHACTDRHTQTRTHRHGFTDLDTGCANSACPRASAAMNQTPGVKNVLLYLKSCSLC